MSSWWLRRSLAFRIALPVGVGVVVALLVLSVLTSALLRALMVDGTDVSLQSRVDSASSLVAQGKKPVSTIDAAVRVLNTAGQPVDGGAPVGLSGGELRDLKSGVAVLTSQRPPHRWLGQVVTASDGSQRLVVAGAALISYAYTSAQAQRWMFGGSVFGGIVACALTWGAVRLSLRPVRRIRAAAEKLPAGQRLPVPAARDELRELAEALNAVLGRRDDATARLQRFTGDAAHELRSPVASIRAQAEVAVLHPDPDGAQEVLTDVVAESERLSNLVADLLVLARSDAGELPTAESVDLPLAVHSAIERLALPDIAVRFDAPAGHCSVSASPAEVKLVLDNLLRNAARYARAQIIVTVFPFASSVRLFVDDDGPGIPLAHREKVFDRFYRIADDRARDSGGSGLGLALVSELVGRRRGSVRVLESLDGGARFEIRWPAAR
jgi:signal transduction histidine kinase